MALFNFTPLVSSSQVFIENRQYQQLELAPQASSNLDVTSKVLYLKNILKDSNDVNSNNSPRKLLLAAESTYRFSKSHTGNPRLINELLNKYWQQTIFLSLSNPVSKEYLNQLTKQESLIAKHMKQKLLIAFSKALLHGNIDSDTIVEQQNAGNQPFPYIKYRWQKGFNLELPKNVSRIFQNSTDPYFPNRIQNDLVQQLKKNNIPLFAVTNCFKQLIVLEPSSKVLNKKGLKNNLLQWYSDRLLPSKKYQSLYESWFFVNPQDANEYKEHIIAQYTRSSKQHKLSITSSGIDFYYRLNRNAPSRMEFRLFPDLKEVSRLIGEGRHKQNLIFDKRQNHGRSYFQGQPIYFIEPVTCSKKHRLEKITLDYSYNIPGDTSGEKYNAIFFNKATALQGWKNFCEQMKEYNLPSKPILRVYNLEDFLKDMEANDYSASRNFLFVPGSESYQNIEQKYLVDRPTNVKVINKYAFPYVSTAKLWFQRMIWSLTSRQPPSW
uniref:hypothetical protein n=1 Tax=Rhodochorton tenue TaxID=173034 RepID=UPI002A7FF644|nr:hypothetical protein UYM82_pgp035 [Rhodochorton tenue]WOK79540.1 hypothetical protein [Rhodochorton tenue]